MEGHAALRNVPGEVRNGFSPLLLFDARRSGYSKRPAPYAPGVADDSSQLVALAPEDGKKVARYFGYGDGCPMSAPSFAQ